MRLFSTIIMTLISVGLLAQSTSWNEYKLKEHWKTNGADEIEGIYEDAAKSYYGAKYRYGLIKIDDQSYNLIYFSGVNQDDAWRWKIGDIKV